MSDHRSQRVDVSNWEVVNTEAGGADAKSWLSDDEGSRWLYKPVTIKNGNRQGEDWAEKVSSLLGLGLGVPCAQVELAVRGGVEGSISLKLTPEDYDMHPGFLAMEVHGVVGYVRGNTPGRPGHSIRNIFAVLESYGTPPGSTFPSHFQAKDVLCGYLLLDAWIANRDRHDENWSILQPRKPGMSYRLSGSYDHAGSLGFNLTDKKRTGYSSGAAGNVQDWAKRGTAWRFEHVLGAPIQSLTALAADALSLVSKETKDFWITRLHEIDLENTRAVVEQCGGMSDAASTFAIDLLTTNLERLRDECI
ncbi:hypothetical protein [Cryobacterium arcticum]|uniref:Uncharacterized protein n=1 Tax=Cryobacterium arcticum TaxID=670052 RepID=A0A1B1BPK2_9MICO|nr:hypothetical protein [Cryobacterium arcticum]ANP74600.1 hypothetical protein PA27867_3683 [Cryobacterium arcticum]